MPVHPRIPVPALMLATGIAIAAVFSYSPANAQILCDCCGRGTEPVKAPPHSSSLPTVCQKPCRRAERTVGLCRPMILPDLHDRARRNPLLGVDLKYLDLSGLTPLQLERVRRWAEKWRGQAERQFRKAKADVRLGRIDAEAFRKAEATRDAIVINYQHVIRAYRTATKNGRRK